ncbi:hypothetical protein M8J76_001779 [Diaphorina citri]|nr:hypothetical protein M8J76_001779 [Diaphorina citri]
MNDKFDCVKNQEVVKSKEVYAVIGHSLLPFEESPPSQWQDKGGVYLLKCLKISLNHSSPRISPKEI